MRAAALWKNAGGFSLLSARLGQQAVLGATQTAAYAKVARQTGPEAGEGPDPFDLEFDRFNGGAMADAEAAARGKDYAPPEPLDRPVDINFELDMDDPEAVDVEALYSEKKKEDYLKGRPVELDDEYDLVHDRAQDLIPNAEEAPDETPGRPGEPFKMQPWNT